MYHYAGNNPVRYIDPDGRVFKFDDNSSQDFKKDFMLSLKYLMQSETGSAIIKELQSSDTVFTIKECTWINSSDSAEGADFFDPKTNTIYWSGKWTLLAKNGNYNSPAICLMHELTHAWEKRTKTGMATYQKFINNNRQNLMSNKFDKPTEEFATFIEKNVAADLGECKGRDFYNDLQWVPNDRNNPTKYYSVQRKVSSPLEHSGINR